MKALIVSCDVDTRECLSNILKRHGTELTDVIATPVGGVKYAVEQKPDLVILDLGTEGASGIRLGTAIRAAYPEAALVYVSQNKDMAFEAYETYPTDYLLKPLDENRFWQTLEYLRHRHREKTTACPARLHIQCFGSFKLTVDGAETKFPTQKARELLAFLLCHYNKPLFRDDLIRILFDTGNDKKDSNYYRVTMFRLRHCLGELGVGKEQLLLREDGTIEMAEGVCDMVDFLRFIAENQVIDDSNVQKAHQIIDIVQGDLFGDIDTFWVTEAREIIIAKLEQLTLQVAAWWLREPKTQKKAEQLLLKHLEMDDMSEQGYAMLLKSYIKVGETSKYIHTYRRYAKILKFDLGLKPERWLTDYYMRFAGTAM